MPHPPPAPSLARRVTLVGLATICLASSAWTAPPGPGSAPILTLDSPMFQSFDMREFRNAQDTVSIRGRPAPSLEGLSRLRCSGSSNPSIRGLALIKAKVPATSITIVDLRQESHGFLNGLPVHWRGFRNWANRSKGSDEAAQDEADRLARLASARVARVVRPSKSARIEDELYTILVRDVQDEESACRALGLGYLRLRVPDHSGPPDDQVDRFVEAAARLPRDGWLHLHCEAGRGRTATFMVMYDMMKNAPRVRAQDILSRQALLGGQPLLELPATDSWQYEPAAARLDFLRLFHRYCRESHHRFETPWSEWKRRSAGREASKPGEPSPDAGPSGPPAGPAGGARPVLARGAGSGLRAGHGRGRNDGSPPNPDLPAGRNSQGEHR
ncbi:MAG: hypothetical protein HY815_08295 [Candidatus Riflebacteria bacterium]|nr:hypothetical protein [Candidatus Riflebacteria bacterium]